MIGIKSNLAKKDIIKSSIGIDEILSRYATKYSLNRKNFTLCFAHQEDTPSMRVDLKRNTVCCFGCGFRGDQIEVVKKIFNLTFYEAMEKIIEDFNIEIPDCTEEEIKNQNILSQEKQRQKKIEERKISIINNRIIYKLRMLRKENLKILNRKFVSNEIKEKLDLQKNEIEKLEEMYFTINGIKQKSEKIKKTDLIEKIMNGQVKI